MKVYVFIDRFPYFSETFIYNQVKELLNQGIDARMIYLNNSGCKVDHNVVFSLIESGRVYKLLHGLKFKLFVNFFKSPLVCLKLFKYYSFKQGLFYILNLDRFNDIENSDILHVHFGRMGVIVAKLYEAKVLSKVRLVNSFHGYDISPDKVDLYKIQYKNLFKYSSLLIVNSNYSLMLLKSINLSIIDKAILLPVGVDQDLFYSFSDSKVCSGFSIVYAGRLIRLKGALLALKISKKLTSIIPNFILHIIGDGEDMSMLLDFVETENLTDYVVFHGALTQEDIKLIFCDASVFIAPGITDPESGRAESQGLVIQEAQSVGLPVIVSNAGGMKYGLIDGKSGFVVPEGDLEQFCEKILFFYNNPEEIISFGRNGRLFVKMNFHNNFLVNRLINYYKLI